MYNLTNYLMSKTNNSRNYFAFLRMWQSGVLLSAAALLMASCAKDGYDVVSGWKQHRQDNKLTKNLPSKLYNWTARKVTGIKLHDMNCGLKAYKNEVVKSIEVYGEMHRYIPYLAKNAGYAKIGEKPVHHQKRKYGTSKSASPTASWT